MIGVIADRYYIGLSPIGRVSIRRAGPVPEHADGPIVLDAGTICYPVSREIYLEWECRYPDEAVEL